MSDLAKDYLKIVKGQFEFFKERSEKGLEQLSNEQLHWKPSEESNSIAILMKHLSGNMHSRWVDFLITDGEKEYRKRDLEFIDNNETREFLMKIWEQGWELLFTTIESLKSEDLDKIIFLRNRPISVMEAIQIEVAHISYHLGQILYIGKQIKDKDWRVLSIPKNSVAINK